MYKILILISLALTAISSNLFAEEIVIQAEGNALKTATLPNHVYEARAIADALQSVVQSAAQSLGSFSLVENGRVVFDQISTQSNIKIAGYRVLPTHQVRCWVELARGINKENVTVLDTNRRAIHKK